jgi:hypothetical protein
VLFHFLASSPENVADTVGAAPAGEVSGFLLSSGSTEHDHQNRHQRFAASAT